MKLRLKDFRNSKELIINAFKRGGINEVRFLCCVSHINLIAAYTFILEELQDGVVEKARESLMEFYGVKEIIDD